LLGLGRAEEALAAYQRQFELGWRPATALYNQACCWVRLGEPDNAFLCLAEAAELDPTTLAMARVDPDLAPLRSDIRFAERIGD
jgi:tetratricopeptide (TPR) repeat protein